MCYSVSPQRKLHLEVPIPLIFSNDIFQHPYYSLVGGLSEAITLRIIGGEVIDDDIELMAEAGELGRFEALGIISDNFGGTTKMRQYVLLHEFDYHCIYRILG